jgi:CubicO group peptidase (beta-lactamase class C family)
MRFLVAVALTALIASPSVAGDRDAERIVTRRVASIVPPDGAGGVAVALRIEGRSLFFNYGWADRAGKRLITTDTLFNLASLRKVFETTLLAQAVRNGEIRLDDSVAKYVVELQQGGDIRQVTLGQLATHTSGLLLPQITRLGRIGATRCRSSSRRSTLGRRIGLPVSGISIPTRALSCCSSHSSAATPCRSTS